MKTITLQLGGKERTLDVGKFYFTKYLGEYIGSDPLKSNANDAGTQFNYSVAIVYAGLMTDHKANGLIVDFTKEDVEGWVGLLEMDEVVRIIDEYGKLNKSEVPGE